MGKELMQRTGPCLDGAGGIWEQLGAKEGESFMGSQWFSLKSSCPLCFLPYWAWDGLEVRTGAALPGLGLAAGGTEAGSLDRCSVAPSMHRFHNSSQNSVINQASGFSTRFHFSCLNLRA